MGFTQDINSTCIDWMENIQSWPGLSVEDTQTVTIQGHTAYYGNEGGRPQSARIQGEDQARQTGRGCLQTHGQTQSGRTGHAGTGVCDGDG